MPKPPQFDDDLIERAARLIICGRDPALPAARPFSLPIDRATPNSDVANTATVGSGAELARALRDAEIESTLNAYFSGLRAADIHGALGVLDDATSASDDVQHVIKQLAAYIRWAAITGATQTADDTPVEPLAARMAVAISRRLAGDVSPDSLPESPSFWPRWRPPGEVLGWKRPRHRVADPRIEERNIAIAVAAAEREHAGNGEPDGDRLISPATVKALAQKFKLSPGAIRAVVAEQADYFKLFKARPELIEEFRQKSVRA